jgi:hypothetical protein
MKKIFYVKYQINCIVLLLLQKRIYSENNMEKNKRRLTFCILPSTPYLWAYIIAICIDQIKVLRRNETTRNVTKKNSSTNLM